MEKSMDMLKLLQSLGERVASKNNNNNGETQSSSQGDGDCQVEARFRTFLPNLLRAYFHPPSAKDRELTAILKLFCHTVKNFPGTFYNGKAHAILPVVGWIIPFFAEPSFAGRHSLLFETMATLLSLLSTGDREAYCQFFLDAMLVIEDLLSVASFYATESDFTASTALSITCFGKSFLEVYSNSSAAPFCDLPNHSKAPNSPAILIDITGDTRWQPFANWILMLLNRCMIESRFQVEGLITSSFISKCCGLLCYADGLLQRACFDFVRITSLSLDAEAIPIERLILSIVSILSDHGPSIPFRTAIYDSALGACLVALYDICPKYIVECTAQELLSVFTQTLLNTASQELKVAMCNAYVRIANICPPYIWKLDALVELLHCSDPCFQLVDCIKVAVEVLGPQSVGGEVAIKANSSSNDLEQFGGKKRVIEDADNTWTKRLKSSEGLQYNLRVAGVKPAMGTPLCTSNMSVNECTVEHSSKYVLKQQGELYAAYLHKLILNVIDSLNPDDVCLDSIKESRLTALSILYQVFCKYPNTLCYVCIVQKSLTWIPWILKKGQEGTLKMSQLSLFLDVVNRILLLKGFLSGEKLRGSNEYTDMYGEQFSCNQFMTAETLFAILKLPWTLSSTDGQSHANWKIKCKAITVVSKTGIKEKSECNLEVLDLALNDQNSDVRAEAVASMPILVFSCYEIIKAVCKRLEVLGQDISDKVREMVGRNIGYLACIFAAPKATENAKDKCQFHQNVGSEINCGNLDILMSGFCCPQCDNNYSASADEGGDYVIYLQTQKEDILNTTSILEFGVSICHSLFAQLLFHELSQQVQVACIKSISRLLRHASKSGLAETKNLWIKCLEVLPLHENRAVREAFCSQIHCFTEKNVMDSLFENDNTCNKTKEENMLRILKHSLAATKDPDVFETLLETVSQIMKSAVVDGFLFFFSFALLIDQLDNPNIGIRVTAARLIHKSATSHQKDGMRAILSKFGRIRDELFEYLNARLVARPVLISEFAEAILGIPSVDLVRQMVPIVLPKLVAQQQNDHTLATLHELAMQLNTDLPYLLLEWCHKVLSFVLLHSDAKELVAVMQFYEVQTGSNAGEIFAAVVPVLLEELVHFLGDSGSDDTNIRLARVPQMIQEVALLVTGSGDLPGFLRNYFVGLLNSIDTKMLRIDDQLLQKQALGCLEKLIEMIGPHLSAFVPKIMVLLVHAVEKESLQYKGLCVWHLFIQRLAQVSPLSLKHVAPQVVAALMPCLEKEQHQLTSHVDKVVEILEELVIKNRQLLEEQLLELPLLPSLSKLANVNQMLQEARGSLCFREQLRHAVGGLNHLSLSVRYTTAMELTNLLRARREDVNAMILGEVSSDSDVLSLLITSLLRGCAEESRTPVGQKLKLVCAECLGDLGAVDPVKFQKSVCQRFKIECSDDDIIFELIHEHLARVFRAASDTTVQDSAALAIQELLKLAGCQASLDDNLSATSDAQENNMMSSDHKTQGKGSNNTVDLHKRGEKLWNRFSDYIRDIIAPCLTSKFHLQYTGDSTAAGPIYRPSLSFRRWIYLWIMRLTSQATGIRANIFNACRGIVRHDMGTALYLLPYLVLNVVCYGTPEARKSVTEEILSVLAEATSKNNDTKICRTGQDILLSSSKCGLSGQSEVCIQAIFTLLDNLGQWVDDLKQEMALSKSLLAIANGKTMQMKAQTDSQLDVEQIITQCNHVSELLEAVPKVTLAEASYRCHAYARSLLYFETHVRNKSGSFNPAAGAIGAFANEDMSFLMKIYSDLDEPDGLFGLARLCKSPKLQDQIIINEKSGNWAEALTCCEKALQMEPTSVTRHLGVLNCLLNMCHLQAVVTHVDGLISRIPEYRKEWCMRGVQATWRLGRWDLMGEYLSVADKEGLVSSSPELTATFDISLAKILQALRQNDHYMFAENVGHSRQALLAPLAAAGMESYTRAYPFVVKLHMLRELEDFHALITKNPILNKQECVYSDPKVLKMIKDWDDRLKFTQPSLRAREPILALRRIVFSASNLHAEVGNCWLQYAKLCRTAGHYETASRAILEAQSSGTPNVHMELAKLHWDAGKSDRAIAELQQALANVPVKDLGEAAKAALSDVLLVPSVNPLSISATQARRNENLDTAKNLLLLARWVHYTGQKQKEDVISLYGQVRTLMPKWEKSFFFMGKYHDELVADIRKRQEENLEDTTTGHVSIRKQKTDEKPWWSHLPDVLLFYAKGLHRGHSRLYQAMPRLLTLWFEFGSMYHIESLSSDSILKSTHDKVMTVMRGCVKDLPSYQWLTALSQIVSRICHQNEEVVRLVKHIITIVLQTYPQQALWTMAAVSKSTVPARRQAAAEIIQTAKKASRQDKSKNNLFIQFASLIDHLIKLCFHGGQPKSQTISISNDFAPLKRMMPVGVIMPVQLALTVTMPPDGISDKNYDPFAAGNYATISGIGEEVEILASLQRPKKIILHGSNGADHPFLCKPKDDLRKDARMMEFTTMINRLLSKEPKSRRRKLYIRTFAVIPLTEDCGIVEWVPHTRGLRHILQDLYIACGKFDRQKTNATIKRHYDQCESNKEAELFKTKILPMFPPVFHKWFMSTFSEPASWFRARVAYAHTTAVWSMVGQIVGLGDRHGENILFDSTTGDCVHVDFSCLFDKGLQLEKPELVPFRLTQMALALLDMKACFQEYVK
ncbi:serine/threonine-protein kinase ATR isoform X2 [Cryptomeria japonica]|uniref:serine/threonine-protein kinase ATR isoform X2 n=1 Tax=Cryptomeria japonica TaxID=3369 RepID=UPI0025AD78B6|nr:serine/threonine-protein kinase ATR isoform X2 [Cryptomeria japonica]